VNESKSSLQIEGFQALGVLCSLRSKTKLAVASQRETDLESNKENDPWSSDYVDRETAAVRKRVEDTETA